MIPKEGEAENGQGRLILRNPEKGAFARGALRKFVANCAPNLRKSAGISFRTSEEGCAKLSQICREFESQFRTIEIHPFQLQAPMAGAEEWSLVQ